ncbi:MAG: flavin reductase [Devosiaceae bacterium]|nr:flavin reductase [Devosiaceae bacterium MH13]
MATPLEQKAIEMFSHSLCGSGPAGSVSPDTFIDGMRALAGAVNVLTTQVGGQRYGLTATAVCSLSTTPPRLIACVNQKGRTFGALRDSGVVAVNSLDASQCDVATAFAGAGAPDVDRFETGDWLEGAVDGCPVLKGACVTFECRIAEVIEAASHGILICDVFEVNTTSASSPLVYCDGAFKRLEAAA